MIGCRSLLHHDLNPGLFIYVQTVTKLAQATFPELNLIAARIPPGRAGIDDEAATWRLEGPGGGSWGPGRGPGGPWGVPGGPGGVPGGVPGGSRGGPGGVPGGSRGVPGGSRGVLRSLLVGSWADLGGSRAPRGIPVNRWNPKCAENLVKNDANEQRKRAHDTLWGEYFGSQVVPGRGIKGEVNLPLGRGKVKCNFFSNTPWAAGPANLNIMMNQGKGTMGNSTIITKSN